MSWRWSTLNDQSRGTRKSCALDDLQMMPQGACTLTGKQPRCIMRLITAKVHVGTSLQDKWISIYKRITSCSSMHHAQHLHSVPEAKEYITIRCIATDYIEQPRIGCCNRPRVSGAVGARWRHISVRSIKSKRSSASEYLLKSSIFWPDVPRNLLIDVKKF